ncbi:LytTR family two component transcriptional regulator [Arcticibacter tournemirensis]|uniref:Response regulator transcription factor n=1 Tax=Arcticibacter tournemirensis TaxID=699437 RepID=A0A4Q0M640_9SPHI|nr:LytTR family DNA-binding domain-containing protein [Arcticibacter tournemirensis]KAA8482429.1 response regulator transcription factor [Arcticibacter tournemirensis]RXF68209.1 response regulator transcription factor [Arcticibacter tournemirensis]TQM51685.1 LytTR family two component transcriptional regulator [Arcticibacter tournemirensis]
MITIAIIEDEPAVRKEISYLIQQETDTVLSGWADNVRSAQKLIEEKRPDVILLDIQLRDGTAFDLLKELNPIPQNIIFITAYNHFAIKAIKYGALDYLLKPIDQTELKEALERFRRRRENNPQWMQQLSLTQESIEAEELPENIVLNSLNNMRIVRVQDIIYCKGDGPYTFFFLNNGTKELISKPLKYYEDLLPAPYFLRTHQSYLVNRQYVTGVSRSEYIVLKNSEEIPISIRRKSSILALLLSEK